MIREFDKNDINQIIEIWLEVNIKTHDFIPKNYWKDQYDNVKNLLPKAEIYVYEENKSAIRFYERENFIIVSQSIDTDTNEEQILMLWK